MLEKLNELQSVFNQIGLWYDNNGYLKLAPYKSTVVAILANQGLAHDAKSLIDAHKRVKALALLPVSFDEHHDEKVADADWDFMVLLHKLAQKIQKMDINWAA